MAAQRAIHANQMSSSSNGSTTKHSQTNGLITNGYHVANGIENGYFNSEIDLSAVKNFRIPKPEQQIVLNNNSLETNYNTMNGGQKNGGLSVNFLNGDTTTTTATTKSDVTKIGEHHPRHNNHHQQKPPSHPHQPSTQNYHSEISKDDLSRFSDGTSTRRLSEDRGGNPMVIGEKINDVYVNRSLLKEDSSDSLLYMTQTTKIRNLTLFDPKDDLFSEQPQSIKNDSFFLHDPSKKSASSTTTITNNNLEESKIYNAFTKLKLNNNQPVQANGYVGETLATAKNFTTNQTESNFMKTRAPASIVVAAKQTPIRKWDRSDSFEEDELASILGCAILFGFHFFFSFCLFTIFCVSFKTFR